MSDPITTLAVADTTAATVAPVPPLDNEAIIVPADTTISSIGDITKPQVAALADFDPAIHAVGPDGEPKKKPNGEYAQKRGRKPGSRAAASVLPPRDAPTTANAGSTDSPPISSDEAARQFCNLGINLAVLTLGDDWAPVDRAEATGLQAAFKNYFDATGPVELPAWAGLAMAVGAYSLTRIGRPTTRERAVGLYMRAKSTIARMRSMLAPGTI